ncbi:hypothetical protein LTR13_009463 [Exophiala sideris]|nr:hypothetical protein LTR13_009463 [Exophiala sideris]
MSRADNIDESNTKHQTMTPEPHHRPHHISLVDRHSLRAKLQHVGDAYYNIDALPSHEGVLAPSFDVFEIDSLASGDDHSNSDVQNVNGWLIVGDIPGIKLSDVKIEWVDQSVLFVRGRIPKATGQTLNRLDGFRGIEAVNLKPLHKERQEGLLERSITFPTIVDVEDVRVEVENGVVLIRVLTARSDV